MRRAHQKLAGLKGLPKMRSSFSCSISVNAAVTSFTPARDGVAGERDTIGSDSRVSLGSLPSEVRTPSCIFALVQRGRNAGARFTARLCFEGLWHWFPRPAAFVDEQIA